MQIKSNRLGSQSNHMSIKFYTMPAKEHVLDECDTSLAGPVYHTIGTLLESAIVENESLCHNRNGSAFEHVNVQCENEVVVENEDESVPKLTTQSCFIQKGEWRNVIENELAFNPQIHPTNPVPVAELGVFVEKGHIYFNERFCEQFEVCVVLTVAGNYRKWE